MIDNTSKTRVIFEINKGSNKLKKLMLIAKLIKINEECPYKYDILQMDQVI